MIMRGSCLEICHGKRMSAFEIYFWCYYIVLGTTSIPILVKATIVRKAEKSTRENSLCKPSWFWCSIRFMVIFLISVAHESNCLFKIVKNMKILRPLKCQNSRIVKLCFWVSCNTWIPRKKLAQLNNRNTRKRCEIVLSQQ